MHIPKPLLTVILASMLITLLPAINDNQRNANIFTGCALTLGSATTLFMAVHQKDPQETIHRTGLLLSGLFCASAAYSYFKASCEESTPQTASKTPYTLADLAGDIPHEVLELVAMIQNTPAYAEIGATIPRGILLHGPGGTGKTSLARAIAGEVNAAFFSISGSECNEMYIGLGAKRLRDLFQSARALIDSKQYPYAIIFIDEIDAIGGSRLKESCTEQRNTLNELLNQMDGFTTRNDIFVIGATNSIQILDKALLRPGRFDKLVAIDLPSESDRLTILQHYSSKTVHAISDECFMYLAQETHDCSGAELKSLINEAALHAIHTNNSVISDDDCFVALDKIITQKQYR